MCSLNELRHHGLAAYAKPAELLVITADRPPIASPWQNDFAERLIGSIQRECVDYIIVLREAHLRRILQAYARYYNNIRTHRSLDKDAPLSRFV